MNIKNNVFKAVTPKFVGLLVVATLLLFGAAQLLTPSPALANTLDECPEGTITATVFGGVGIYCTDGRNHTCPLAELSVHGGIGETNLTWSCPASVTSPNQPGRVADPGEGSGAADSFSDGFTSTTTSGTHDCEGVSISIDVECVPGVNPIVSYLTAIVNFLSMGVGIVIIGSVMVGGIQYMTAGGNPQSTQAAIGRITNALIALITFIFLFAFFNWLMPSGML